MFSLKRAKVGDQVVDSFGNKGLIHYINATLGIYDVKFEGGNHEYYNVKGDIYDINAQPAANPLMAYKSATKATGLQALDVATKHAATSFNLTGASKGDRVTNSLGQQGTIEYVINVYGIRLNYGRVDRYYSNGKSDESPYQIESWEKVTTPQTLPAAAKNYPTLSDIDVNGNIQILTPRGWELCHFLKGEYQKQEWAHTPLYVNVRKKLARRACGIMVRDVKGLIVQDTTGVVPHWFNS
jgi:hypothetical protein